MTYGCIHERFHGSQSWSYVARAPRRALWARAGAIIHLTKRTLHFDRWLHFARELCLLNRIEIFLTGTDNMMADGFTKPVDKTKFLKCRDYVMAKA